MVKPLELNIDDPKQPMRQANIDAIVEYIKEGIKPRNTGGKLGVEVEHFIVKNSNEPVMFSDEHGVDWLLNELSGAFPLKTYGTDGELIGVARDGQSVTLEPGAQVELSSGPYDKVCSIQKDFEQFVRTVSEALAPYDEHIVALGYRPRGIAADIELIPKKRYAFMDTYFARIGDYGRRMMRCSAATQISIDFFSEADCLRKLRLASILAPLLTLICDNTPVFENEPSSHPMMRADVWRYCDPDRCESVPNVADKGFSLQSYAAFVLDTPAILVPDGDDYRPTAETFGEVYANALMNRHEIEHALSMLFTDVRVKTYLEIRPADSMPAPYVAAYASLIKGLLYCEKNLDRLDALYRNVETSDIAMTRTNLASHGYDGTAYGKPAQQAVIELLEMAKQGLEEDERPFLEPLVNLARNKQRLAQQR